MVEAEVGDEKKGRGLEGKRQEMIMGQNGQNNTLSFQRRI